MTTGTRRAILRNAVKCLTCMDIIESTHRHDFVTCSCWTIDQLLTPDKQTGVFVDGGLEYLRYGMGNAGRLEPLFEFGELSDVRGD